MSEDSLTFAASGEKAPLPAAAPGRISAYSCFPITHHAPRNGVDIVSTECDLDEFCVAREEVSLPAVSPAQWHPAPPVNDNLDAAGSQDESPSQQEVSKFCLISSAFLMNH